MPTEINGVPRWEHELQLLRQDFQNYKNSETERRLREEKDRDHDEQQRNYVELGFKIIVGLLTTDTVLTRLDITPVSTAEATIRPMFAALGLI
jgi:hypothetical protein